MKKPLAKIFGLLLISVLLTGCTFAGDTSTLTSGTPGFFMGIWHGILAPFTLVIRLFIDIKMYAVENSGLGYDAGFLLGFVGAVPLGWIVVLISIGFYLLA